MFNISKLNKYDKKHVIIITVGIFFILSISNIIESYAFFSNVDAINNSVSSADIIIYIVSGINADARANLIDILRFTIPYLLILLFTGVHLANVLENNNKYIYLIRYKSYGTWFKKNVVKLIRLVVIYFAIYYLLLIILASMFMDVFSSFTKVFYMLYPFYDGYSSFLKLLIYQWLLSILWESVFVLMQFLLGLFIKDVFKNFTIMSLAILIFTFIVKNGCYNPLMLSKHSIMNTTISVNPLITLSFGVIIILVLNLFISKIIQIAIRRNCI